MLDLYFCQRSGKLFLLCSLSEFCTAYDGSFRNLSATIICTCAWCLFSFETNSDSNHGDMAYYSDNACGQLCIWRQNSNSYIATVRVNDSLTLPLPQALESSSASPNVTCNPCWYHYNHCWSTGQIRVYPWLPSQEAKWWWMLNRIKYWMS